jgi:hypothetical protein
MLQPRRFAQSNESPTTGFLAQLSIVYPRTALPSFLNPPMSEMHSHKNVSQCQRDLVRAILSHVRPACIALVRATRLLNGLRLRSLCTGGGGGAADGPLRTGPLSKRFRIEP